MNTILAIIFFAVVCVLVECRSKWPRHLAMNSNEESDQNGCSDSVPGVFCQRFSENGFCYDPRYQSIAKKNCVASCGNCPSQGIEQGTQQQQLEPELDLVGAAEPASSVL